MTTELVPSTYDGFLRKLKDRVRRAQLQAALSVNSRLVLLYWRIGRDILSRQREEGWGAKVVARLARDLRSAFPEMKGFSPRNLLFMRSLAEAYPDEEIVKQLVSLLPWGHNVRLVQKVKEPAKREWYLRTTLEQGWSRDMMLAQIDSGLYERQGRAPTNFEWTLPAPQSDLAQQVVKDPYNFDFLVLHENARERELERGLLAHIREFLLELGVGFAFVGNQVPIEVGDQDFYLDLLFYHLHLRCYVVIDLKIGDFKPEYAGKMNFYLSAVDSQLLHEDDHPSIGLLLCRSKDQVIVEYALRDLQKPIGVSDWETRIVNALPEELEGSLPTVEQLETELSAEQESQGNDDS